MSAFVTTFVTILLVAAVVMIAGYLLTLLAAVTFDAAAGRLTLPGPVRVVHTSPTRRRQRMRTAWHDWRGMHGGVPLSRWA